MAPSLPSAETSSSVGRSLAPAGSVFVRDGAAWSELTPVAGQAFRLRLGGPFRPAWMAALGSGLAERRISIDQVHAKRGRDGSWIAELKLLALEGAVDPRSVSYIGLANQAPPQVAGSCQLRVERYELEASADHGGTLKLRFEAPDSLGLLGGMFCSLAGLSLYALEMHIATRGGRAEDCLWLVGESSAVPTEATQDALEALLRASLAG